MKYEIKQDRYPENPREFFETFTKMWCFHKKYDLGDKHPHHPAEFGGWEDFKRHIIQTHEIAFIEPLYLYDHSGITIRTFPFSCPWDSGQVGFVFMEKEMASTFFHDDKIAHKALIEEVKTYDQYLTGDVWCIAIIDDDGEEMESVCGYYGHDDAEKEAQSQLEFYQQKANV
jgi:hypothetical protein